MSLTGSQHQQLQDALLAAFGTDDALRQMLKLQLDVELNAVAKPGSLTQRVFDLVTWAREQGRIAELIEGAMRHNPGNPELQALAAAAPDWHVAAPAEPDGAPPYQGLAFFGVADQARFFGREALTAELVTYVREHPFLAVVGASGSGKSSVVRAGLVAALQQGASEGSASWAVHVITPTARPVTTLAAALTATSESVTAQATLMDDLRREPRSLDLYATRLLARLGAPRLLLVVDQFEELFTLCREREERQALVDNLLTAATPGGVTTVVLALRADFYGHCAEFATLRTALEQYQRYIGPMSREELRTAIEGPAAQGYWELEAGLGELMLEDVADESGALPLLSHALLETWRRRSGRTMTFAGYREAGGVRGAIARTADAVYSKLAPAEQAIARQIFLRLTSLGEGTADTRRRVALAELEGSEETAGVLKQLADARLVAAEREQAAGGAAVYVDVTHEALIREWPRLREWLNEDREGLRVQRRLTEAAQQWAALDEDPGALYRGVLLAQSVEWAAQHSGELNERERRFLEASWAQEEGEARARDEAQRRELEQARALAAEEKKVRVRQRWLLLAVTGLLVGVVAASLLAVTQLAQLQAEQLLQEGRILQSECQVELARTKLEAALAANPKLAIDVAAEDAATRRACAIQAVQAGEALAAEGKHAAAGERFAAALALEPPPDTPVYVWISPTTELAEGVFLMGSATGDPLAFDNEQPQHPVVLDGFWMQRTEVTNEQYVRCVEAGRCAAPSNQRWDKLQFARQPVTDVDWDQARTYAEWVGGRLPTEAEWEYACRGGDGRIYPWGNEEPSPDRLNYFYSELDTWTDVGSHPAGANGLYEMAGNVSEWTADWYGQAYYAESPELNPTGPAGGEFRTLRGGSYTENDLRCASRGASAPFDRYEDIGFRVVSPGS